MSPFPPLRSTCLDEESIGERTGVRELDGGAPAGGGRPHPVPVRAPGRPRRRGGGRDEPRDPTGTIFDTDDRYLYLDLSFP